MNVSLYQAAAALNGISRWQDVIGENLASSSIPGYRKQDLSFSAVQSGLMPVASAGYGPSASFILPQAITSINSSAGELNHTGTNTDVAIEGPGFFELQMTDGTHVYTRSGEFKFNTQGELVSKAGYRVAGDAGIIQINPKDKSPVTISDTGEVSQSGNIMGKVKLVDFNDTRLLTPISGTSFFLANNPNLRPTPVTAASLRQGFLEASNTTSVREMANLLTAMRSYEMNQRVIQINDDRISRAIGDLGNP